MIETFTCAKCGGEFFTTTPKQPGDICGYCRPEGAHLVNPVTNPEVYARLFGGMSDDEAVNV